MALLNLPDTITDNELKTLFLLCRIIITSSERSTVLLAINAIMPYTTLTEAVQVFDYCDRIETQFIILMEERNIEIDLIQQ